MKTRLVKIGNSRGVRIPKPLIEEAGLENEVEMRVVEAGILIEGSPDARVGWDEAARRVRERGDDRLIDEVVPTEFDQTEWTWE